MFTLGNKEAIVNATNKFPISIDGTEMTIKGFGTFSQAQIVSALGQRFIAEKLGSLVITCPSASDIGLAASDLRVPVVAHIRVNTTRHSSEWATDFIKRGRPYVFELSLGGGASSTDVANALEDAFTEYESKFPISTLPFDVVNDSAGELTLTLKAGELNFLETVNFLMEHDSYGFDADTTKFTGALQEDGVTPNLTSASSTASVINMDTTNTFSVGDQLLVGDATNAGVEGTATVHTVTYITFSNTTELTVSPDVPTTYVDNAIVTVLTAGEEATNSGKYLEENVRVSNPYTTDAYAIGAGEAPFVANDYTQITWVARATEGTGIGSGWAPHNNLATVAADAKVGNRDQTFTLYFNEDACLDNAGPVDTLIGFLIGGTPVIGDFLKANKEGATTADLFIA